MNSPCIATGITIPLPRPWWRRLAEDWWRRPAARVPPEALRSDSWRESDFRDLRELSRSTLRDIGAPDWLYESRERSRASEFEILRR